MALVILETHGVIRNGKLRIDRLPMPGAIRRPKRGLVTLYGQTAIREIAQAAQAARQSGTLHASARIHVEVNGVPKRPVTPQTLPAHQLLHTDRLSAALESRIRSLCIGYLAAAGESPGAIDRLMAMDYLRFLGRRPDLLDHLLQEPEFQHIKGFVFRSHIENGEQLYRAILTDRAAIVDIDLIGHHAAQVIVPDF